MVGLCRKERPRILMIGVERILLDGWKERVGLSKCGMEVRMVHSFQLFFRKFFYNLQERRIGTTVKWVL